MFQVPSRAAALLGRLDLFAVLPTWTFFAPNPATTDFHLIARERRRDGTVTEFAEVPTCRHRRKLFHAVWYPTRRFTKVVHDVMSDLARMSKLYTPVEIKLTVSYLTLANYVCHLPAAGEVQSRQFAIVVTHGYDSPVEPILLFTSEFHRLHDAP